MSLIYQLNKGRSRCLSSQHD